MIPARVLKDGHKDPYFLLGFDGELHPVGFQQLGCGEDVIAPEGDGLESADTILVAGRREQSKSRLGSRNEEFNPSLLLVERLVGADLETEFFGVELKGRVLVADRNSGEFDATNHLYFSP